MSLKYFMRILFLHISEKFEKYFDELIWSKLPGVRLDEMCIFPPTILFTASSNKDSEQLFSQYLSFVSDLLRLKVNVLEHNN